MQTEFIKLAVIFIVIMVMVLAKLKPGIRLSQASIPIKFAGL